MTPAELIKTSSCQGQWCLSAAIHYRYCNDPGRPPARCARSAALNTNISTRTRLQDKRETYSSLSQRNERRQSEGDSLKVLMAKSFPLKRSKDAKVSKIRRPLRPHSVVSTQFRDLQRNRGAVCVGRRLKHAHITHDSNI